ncbi:hypothetical protein [Tropicimonas marinistellae]|uniref:hypothetical protein n=1 Tax=Tropicimonas marinistellae TaxID=1739787 RepID=UPI0008372C53|nr:hypothetical protein [Tropicimonas marinistellae]
MRLSLHAAFILFMLTVTAAFLLLSLGLPPETRRAPLVVAIPTLGLLSWLFHRERAAPNQELSRLGRPYAIPWLLGCVLACQFLDAVVVVPLFLLLAFRYWARSGWAMSLGTATGTFILLRMAFPNGLGHPPLF